MPTNVKPIKRVSYTDELFLELRVKEVSLYIRYGWLYKQENGWARHHFGNYCNFNYAINFYEVQRNIMDDIIIVISINIWAGDCWFTGTSIYHIVAWALVYNGHCLTHTHTHTHTHTPCHWHCINANAHTSATHKHSIKYAETKLSESFTSGLKLFRQLRPLSSSQSFYKWASFRINSHTINIMHHLNYPYIFIELKSIQKYSKVCSKNNMRFQQ